MLKKEFLLGCTADRAFYMLLNHVLVVLGTFLSYTQVSNFIVSWCISFLINFLKNITKQLYDYIVEH